MCEVGILDAHDYRSEVFENLSFESGKTMPFISFSTNNIV